MLSSVTGILLISTFVSAQQPPTNDWKYQLCGGGGRLACCPNNATVSLPLSGFKPPPYHPPSPYQPHLTPPSQFDDIPRTNRSGYPTFINHYRGSDWSNFGLFTPPNNSTSDIHPFSPPNTAILPASANGSITMGPPGAAGNLVTFSYACITTSLPYPPASQGNLPTPCTITFVGQCFDASDGSGSTRPRTFPPVVLTYPAANTANGSMARVPSYLDGTSGPFPFPQIPVVCYNYTVTAKSLTGYPVRAFFDSVLFRYLQNCAP